MQIRRRDTIPQELDDPDDVMVNQESFEGSEADRIATATTTASSASLVYQQIHKLPKELRNLLAGGMAGMTAKSVVAPMDRIKILYQV